MKLRLAALSVLCLTGIFVVSHHFIGEKDVIVEIIEVGFSGDHKMWSMENDEPIDPNDQTPIWTKDNGVVYSVCYTMKTHPSVFGKLRVKGLGKRSSSGKIILSVNGNEVAISDTILLQDGDIAFSDLQISDLTPLTGSSAIGLHTYTFEWQIQIKNNNWLALNTSSHEFIWTFGKPETPDIQLDLSPEELKRFSPDEFHAVGSSSVISTPTTPANTEE